MSEEEQLYALRRPDGTFARQGPGKAHEDELEEGVREFKIDRLGKPGERLNGHGKWYDHVDDMRRQIDAGFAADFGPRAKSHEHDFKLIEALIVTGRLETDGLLAREAQVCGRDMRELAEEVIANALAGGVMHARLERRRRKVGTGG